MVLFFFLKFMFIFVSLHYSGSANAVDGYPNKNGDKGTNIESVTAVEKLQGSQFRISAMNVSGKEFNLLFTFLPELNNFFYSTLL